MNRLPDINERIVDDKGRLTEQARLYIQQIETFQQIIGYTPEDVANKQSDLSPSPTRYPTVNAVNTGLASKDNIIGYVVDVASSGGVLTIDVSDNAAVYRVTLAENITSWVFTGYPTTSDVPIISFDVQFQQPGGATYTVSNPALAGRSADGYFYVTPVATAIDIINIELAYESGSVRVRTRNIGTWQTSPMGLAHCRAWARFDPTSLVSYSGTYSRSGNTVTVSIVDHGLKVGNMTYMDYTSGLATDAAGLILTVPDKDTFTLNHAASGATSGNCRFRGCTLRASRNIANIIFTSAGATSGQYYVNYREFMPDQWAAVVYSNGLTNSATSISKGATVSAAGYALLVSYLGTTATDTAFNSVEVWR